MFILVGIGVAVGGVAVMLAVVGLASLIGNSGVAMCILMVITFGTLFSMLGWSIVHPHSSIPLPIVIIVAAGLIMLMLSIAAAGA